MYSNHFWIAMMSCRIGTWVNPDKLPQIFECLYALSIQTYFTKCLYRWQGHGKSLCQSRDYYCYYYYHHHYHNYYHYYYYYYYTFCTTKLLGVYWFHSVRLSVRLSVRPSGPSVHPAFRVHSVAPMVLDRSISYWYILSSNFRRCGV